MIKPLGGGVVLIQYDCVLLKRKLGRRDRCAQRGDDVKTRREKMAICQPRAPKDGPKHQALEEAGRDSPRASPGKRGPVHSLVRTSSLAEE